MIEYLVVHCSDTPDDRDIGAEEIHRWHRERGWDGIGYHDVIRRNGAIERGRPPYWQGAHVKGYNHRSVGVCLVGRDRFSEYQMSALRALIYEYLIQYPSIKLVGHCDLDDSKTCPNFDVLGWWLS